MVRKDLAKIGDSRVLVPVSIENVAPSGNSSAGREKVLLLPANLSVELAAEYRQLAELCTGRPGAGKRSVALGR